MKAFTAQQLTVYFSIKGAKRKKKFVNGYEIVNGAAINCLL